MDPAYIKKMPTEYYNGNESYFGGWSGFYNHYYNTMPKKEKQFGYRNNQYENKYKKKKMCKTSRALITKTVMKHLAHKRYTINIQL